MFGRANQDVDELGEDLGEDFDDDAEEDAEELDEEEPSVAPRRPVSDELVGHRRGGLGPYDVDDPDADDIGGGLDFGSLRVPMPARAQLQVEQGAGELLRAVHVLVPSGRVSLSALAAPRSSHLWRDLAGEIAESLGKDGAKVWAEWGGWGREVMAGSKGALSRFVGVDGPRWMLYGVATGPADGAEELAGTLREMIEGTVVTRGPDALPVKTVLPLRLPEHLEERVEQAREESARRPAALAGDVLEDAVVSVAPTGSVPPTAGGGPADGGRVSRPGYRGGDYGSRPSGPPSGPSAAPPSVPPAQPPTVPPAGPATVPPVGPATTGPIPGGRPGLPGRRPGVPGGRPEVPGRRPEVPGRRPGVPRRSSPVTQPPGTGPGTAQPAAAAFAPGYPANPPGAVTRSIGFRPVVPPTAAPHGAPTVSSTGRPSRSPGYPGTAAGQPAHTVPPGSPGIPQAPADPTRRRGLPPVPGISTVDTNGIPRVTAAETTWSMARPVVSADQVAEQPAWALLSDAPAFWPNPGRRSRIPEPPDRGAMDDAGGPPRRGPVPPVHRPGPPAPAGRPNGPASGADTPWANGTRRQDGLDQTTGYSGDRRSAPARFGASYPAAGYAGAGRAPDQSAAGYAPDKSAAGYAGAGQPPRSPLRPECPRAAGAGYTSDGRPSQAEGHPAPEHPSGGYPPATRRTGGYPTGGCPADRPAGDYPSGYSADRPAGDYPAAQSGYPSADGSRGSHQSASRPADHSRVDRLASDRAITEGPTGGYPPTGGPTRGYPATDGPVGGYPAAESSTGGYPVTGGYPAADQVTGGYPAAAQGSGDYRSTPHPPGGDPGPDRLTPGFPGRARPTGGYPATGQQPAGGYAAAGQQPAGGYAAAGQSTGRYRGTEQPERHPSGGPDDRSELLGTPDPLHEALTRDSAVTQDRLSRVDRRGRHRRPE